MGVLKITFNTLLRAPNNLNAFVLPTVSTRRLSIPCKSTSNKAASWTASKLPTTQKKISENLKLIQVESDPQAKFNDVSGKPLVVILEWLMAKNKHIQKFSDIYLNHGFDVLTVKLKPWQLIWPVTGSQIVAGDLLNTLHENHSNRPIVIHGFSVGGYLWGEVQFKMAQDEEKYKPLVNNISGAIWDSVVDINETAIGVPAALFPKNAMLRNACRKYILYHMKVFEKEATQHWRKSREMFYRPIMKCPALLLFSKTDPIGNPNSYKNVRTSYESMGIQIYEKCWDVSPHVAHFAFHKEEYISEVELFLENIGLLVPVAKRRAAVI